METLVATVLIVVVFLLASMILNSLFSNSVKSNTRAIDAHLNELQYLHKNQHITTPYQEEVQGWMVTVGSYTEGTTNIIEFEATNLETKKTVSKNVYENK